MKKEVWSIHSISNQLGKVVIVTGANSGIGFEVAKAFAQKGAEVILACRSLDRGNAALNEIKNLYPESKAKVMVLDLMDLSSVRNFAENFLKEYLRLDVLVNNAGIMTSPFALTKDGFESQMGTNHLGHFALTGLLLSRILETPHSRVVNVSSLAHKQWNISFENSISEYAHSYKSMRAYARSKLANLLFTYELQRRFEYANSSSLALAAHPGASATNLGRHLEGSTFAKIVKPTIMRVLPTALSGALPVLRASTDENATGGQYYGPSGFLELYGSPVVVKSSRASHNVANAQKLWELSEELTGVRFHFNKNQS